MASIRIPFNFDGGKLQTTSDPSTIANQKIIDVLLTQKFERVMRHNYGAGAQTLLFDNLEESDSLVFSDFKVDAIQDINENVSRVQVVDMYMSNTVTSRVFGSDETTYNINVVYRLPLGSPQVVRVNVASEYTVNEDTPI
jgi:phage baseplate assembly protein W